MRSTMIGAANSAVPSSLARGPSSLRVKPFTRLGKKFDAQNRARLSVKSAAAEAEAPDAAAEDAPAVEDFDFNFAAAKKGNEYTSEDVEAALRWYRREGSQPESDKDHISNEYGIDEDATFFAQYDRVGEVDDDDDDAEFAYAGISEAAAGGSSGFDVEMYERLKEAREAAKFQSLSDNAVMESAMEQDYGDKRGMEQMSMTQQGLGELLEDDKAANDEDDEDAEFNEAMSLKLGSNASAASKEWDWLSFMGEADEDELDEVDDSAPHPALSDFAPQPAAKVNTELELLGLEDEDARDMMELMSAKFLEEEDDDDDDEEEASTDLELDSSVMSALSEFADWTAANNINLADGDEAEYAQPAESPLLTAGEAQVMTGFADFFEANASAESSPLAELTEDDQAVGDDSIWSDIYENSLEMNAKPIADVNTFFDDDGETWVERILEVNRVVTVKKGGKTQGFRASAVVGNGNGLVGVGTGSGAEIGVAVKRALVDAKKKLMQIPLVGPGTIPHVSEVKFKAARVILRPASDGTGVIAGGTIKAVLEVAGVKNVLSKRLGCRSLMNNARATFKALSELKTLNQVSADRGIPMDELLLPRKK